MKFYKTFLLVLIFSFSALGQSPLLHLLKPTAETETVVDTIIYQSDFSSDTDGWSATITNYGNQGTFTAVDGNAVLDVTLGGTRNWFPYLSRGFASGIAGDSLKVVVKADTGIIYQYYKGTATAINHNFYTEGDLEIFDRWGESYNNIVLYWDGEATFDYESDWTSGVDGWINVRSIDAGNTDGIQGEDDWYKIYATGDAGSHYVRKDGIVTGSTDYVFRFKYFIPNGQSNVDGLKLYSQNGGGGWFTLASYSTTGSVVEVVDTLTTFGSNTGVGIQMSTGGSTSFTGAGSSSDDIIYIKDFLVNLPGSGEFTSTIDSIIVTKIAE
jgi:hypothetical protein